MNERQQKKAKEIAEAEKTKVSCMRKAIMDVMGEDPEEWNMSLEECNRKAHEYSLGLEKFKNERDGVKDED